MAKAKVNDSPHPAPVPSKQPSSVLGNLFQRVARRKEEKRRAVVSDIRDLVVLTAQAEAGENIEIDLDSFATAFAESGLSEADVAATVQEYKKRVEWSKLASQADDLRRKAEAAERTAIEFTEQEHARQQLALAKMEELRLAALESQLRSEAAIEARSNLISGACVTDEERELSKQLADVNKRIASCKEKLSPRLHPSTPGGYSASITESPQALVNETQAALANDRLSYSPERRAQLKDRLAKAQEAVKAVEKELRAAEREREAILAKSQAFNAAKLAPESFSIVRSKPDPDERMRRHAREMGVSIHGPSVTHLG